MRTHQQQEIDFIEEYNGVMHAFEIKWNPKTKTRFPAPFLSAYPENETKVINTENFLEFVGTD